MCLIMDSHHQYVPTHATKTVTTSGSGNTVTLDMSEFHQLPADSSLDQRHQRHTEDTGIDRLDEGMPDRH